MKKIEKIMSFVLSLVMLGSLTVFTGFAEEYKDIVIPYKDIAKGQVDRKPYSVCEKVQDSEKGEVYKVSPNTETTEDGKVNIDAWNLTKYNINLNHYITMRIEYKYTSDSDAKYFPAASLSPNGGKTLKAWRTVKADTALEKGKWSSVEIDLTPALTNNIVDGMLWQFHIYPFGTDANAKSLLNGESILIGNITFSAKAAEKNEAVLNMEYTVKFTFERDSIQNPSDITAKPGEKITLPKTGQILGEKTVTKWFCNNDGKYYNGEAEYTMPAGDVEFIAYWQNVSTGVIEPIKISYSDYSGGICNRVDTGTLNTVEFEGKQTIEIIPNPKSQNGGSLNLDGWTYVGAKINAEHYNTAMVVYKYLSDNPVSGKAKLDILKWNEFSKGTYMNSREDIQEGKWAVVSYDMSEAKSKALEGKIPNLGQMHIYPLGANKVGIMSEKDRVYVADMIFIPEKTTYASYNSAYIGGYDDGTFKPGGTMTRAEACTVLARLMADGDANVENITKTSFSDVAENEWYAKYISACEMAGLLTSYSGNFNPNQNITRAEFVELVFKMGLLTDKGKNGTFTDVPENHTKADMISAAGKSGLVNGYDNGDGTFSFKPDNTITRAEVVKVINNALGRSSTAESVKAAGCNNKFADLSEAFWGYADILDAANTHISFKTTDGKEMWLQMDKVIDESGFNPDYEAAINRATEVDALMEKRIVEIRNTTDNVNVSGKKIYVSNKGNDANNGLSESTPVATIDAAQKIAVSGDAILFERGGEWRVNFTTIPGVYYGAYGNGVKPLLNGNLTGDAADASLWTLVEGTTNIYTFKEKLRDVGNIIYNDGSIYTEKLVPMINDKLELCINNVKYDPKTSHTRNNTFFMVYDNITSKTLNMPQTYGTLYLRCDEGNPGAVYNNIEIASYGHTMIAKSDNTIENLCIMYAGGHGITAGTCKNLIIRNCEIGWIGGTSQYINDGKNTRYGNGIQIYGGCDNFVIDNCYVYECYDAGISPQYSAGGTNEVLLKNIFYTNNVIDKCIYNIEYFMGKTASGNAERYIKTMHFTGNILARSGYGWGMMPSRSACIKGWDSFNKASDFIIKDNIILNPAYNAYHIGADFDGWLPEFSANTYIIRRNSQFIKYGANGSAQYTYDSTAEQTAKNVLLENDFTIYYLPEDYKG